MSRFTGKDMARLDDPSSWDADDIAYLQQRNRLPEGFDAEKPESPTAPDLADVPNTGDVGTVPDDFEPEDEGEDYASFTKTRLVSLARERGLDDSGTKQELVDRLSESDSMVL